MTIAMEEIESKERCVSDVSAMERIVVNTKL